jgi:glycosyltransferase involved in cell wall biosynthesis
MKHYQTYYGRIVFTGYLNQDLIKKFMQIADIGIAPSVYDQCPFSILEMAANKIPLILSEIDGITEIFDNEECYFIKPEISPDGEISFSKNELANLLLYVSQDKKSRRIKSDLAYTKLISKFNLHSMGVKTLNCYELAIKNK